MPMSWETRIDAGGFRVRWCDELARRYFAEGQWTQSTLVNAAQAAVAAGPDHLLLIEGARRVSRREAWEKALRLAGFFRARGMRPGDVVSFQLPNWWESAVIALAARMTGLVINPVPPIYRESELAYILADCKAKMIFVPGVFRKFDHKSMIRKLRHSLPELRDVVVVRDSDELNWKHATSLAPVELSDLPRVDPASVMMVMYTSGTTGKPKGVLHIHHAFDHRVRAMAEAWCIGAEDIVFMPSPVTHITGAFWVFDMPWVRGCASVLMDVWTPEEGLRTIEEQRCTVHGGATPFLQQLLELAEDRPDALATLRLFFCGGTTVSPDLIKRASAAFPRCLFFRCYGSTEMTTATLGIRDRSQAALGAETDGEIVYPVEIQIVDPAGDTPIAEGEVGEIIARGPGLFVGYLDQSDNKDAFNEEGFFRMGDLGRRVHGDYLVVSGRKKDIIIRSGENISPKEVEDLLHTHPAVAEVAIVAMPNRTTGERACAFIIPRPGRTIDLAEIRRFLDDLGLARQKFPEHVVLVEELPRVASGKVRKDELRLRARQIAEAQEVTR
jgi:acyl-CoA synthetase (AMP-forming)/AMP-acid ligase II